MNLPSIEIVDDCFFIDATSINTYATCRRSAEYYIVRKRVGQGRNALIFGGAIHKGLEVRYKNDRISHDSDEFDAVETAQMAAMDAYFAANPLVETDMDDHRTIALAKSVIQSYNVYFSKESFEVLYGPHDEPLVEVPFAYEIGTVTFQGRPLRLMWQGRIDAMVRWSDGSIEHIDHKTASRASTGDEFLLDQGQRGYAWATSKFLGQPSTGYTINSLVIRKPTKTGSALDFSRRRIFIDKEAMDEWQENTVVLIQDFLRDYERGYFPMETAWCVGKFGRCPYLDVCTQPREGREPLLYSNNFTTHNWSPLHKD